MRLFTADWTLPVPSSAALDLGDPFPAATWFAARQHACAVLGLDVHQVQVREVEEGYESRECPVEEDDEQASGVRLRLVTSRHVITDENEGSRWVCADHPNAKAQRYVDVMECSVCGHAMLPATDDVGSKAEGGGG